MGIISVRKDYTIELLTIKNYLHNSTVVDLKKL